MNQPGKTNFLSIALLPLLFLIFGGGQVLMAQNTFFVAPNGDDTNDGSESSPWQTLAGARNNIRPVLSQGGNITVYFRAGTYLLNETVVFGPEDGGSEGQQITYAAYNGETPIFSSLRQLNGWTAYGANSNIFVAPIPTGVGLVRYLQDKNEGWLQRSITDDFETEEPAGNEGCLECNWDVPEFQSAKLNIQYGSDFVAPNWDYANQYDLKASGLPWHEEILPIQSVDVNQRRIFTTIPSQYELRRDIEEDAPPRAFVMNSIEGIDEPGEWACLDTGNGYQIYLWPLSDTGSIFVPQLTEFIRIDGGGDGNTWAGTPVMNLVFEGIVFTGGDFRVMKNDLNDITNPATNDITAQHDWAVVDAPDALLRIRNAKNITVRECKFIKSGGTAIRLDRFAQDNLLIGNTIEYMGRNGIVLTGRGPGFGDVNKFNDILYNNIQYTGMEKWSAIALLLSQSSNNYIRKNYIANTKFTALTLCSPRQLSFWSHCQGKGTYLGREFHYYDFSPAAIASMGGSDCENSSEPAMRFVYNYNNVVENNVFVNVGVGDNFFINGKAGYFSGFKKNQGNDFSYNYIYEDDSFGADSDFATYNDSDQDGANLFGNMFHNLNTEEVLMVADAQWAENEAPPACELLLIGNSVMNSTYGAFDEHIGTPAAWYTEDGAIEVNSSGASTGDADFVGVYRKSYQALCPQNLVVPGTPGVADHQQMLSDKIFEFGGVLPTCESNDCIGSLPDAPSNVAVTFKECKMTITWEKSLCAKNYRIQRSENNALWQTISANTTSTTFIDKSLTEGSSYQYRVTAQNDGLWSDYQTSNTITSPCNGLQDDVEFLNMAVYPNPATAETITISGVKRNKNYIIHDMAGNVVQTGRLQDNQLSFTGGPGVYFISIEFLVLPEDEEEEEEEIEYEVLRFIKL
ncbi:MAG: T9SS type A sorting domain-containing protein [Salibacteraceae bacterium]